MHTLDKILVVKLAQKILVAKHMLSLAHAFNLNYIIVYIETILDSRLQTT